MGWARTSNLTGSSIAFRRLAICFAHSLKTCHWQLFFTSRPVNSRVLFFLCFIVNIISLSKPIGWLEIKKTEILYSKSVLAPRRGLEPPTYRLTAECSTIELPRTMICKIMKICKLAKQFIQFFSTNR